MRTTERSVDAGAVDGKRRRQTLDACPPPQRPSPPPAALGTSRTTLTHCPYCSLQCGMNVTAGDRPATLVPADFPTNKGGLCSKGWSSTELLDHPERLLRPLVRATPGDRTSPLVEATWDDALGRLVDAIERTQARYGRDAVGCFGGGLADQRAGLPVRQVRPGRPADQRHRLQRPLLHVLGRGRGQPRLRPGPRHAVPAERHRRGRRRRPGRQQPGRHDAAGDAVLRRRAASAAPSTSSSTRGARPPPATPRCTCSRCPAPTSPWPTACCTSRSPRAWSTRTYVAARTTGFDDVRAGVARVLARPGGAADRRARSPTSGAPSSPWPAPRRRSSSPPAAPSSTAAAPTPPRRGSTWRSPSACPAGPGSGWGTVTGQGNGQGGREHGQKADQLPGYRSLKDPAARAHVAAVWGDRPRRPADAREVARSSCSTRSAPTAGSAPSSSWRRNVAVSAPDARRVISRLRRPRLPRRQRLLPLRDRRARRRRPAQRHVGGGGRHDDQPRGPGHPAPQGAGPADRRPRRPAAAGARWPTGSAPGSHFSGDPETVFEELRRASAGGVGRLLGHQLPADRRRAGRLLALPGTTTHPGTPRLFAERFATPDGRARFLRVEHVDAHERARRRLPLRPHHRPGARPVPVGHPDPPHPQPAAGRPDAARRAAPRPGPPARHRRRTTSSS